MAAHFTLTADISILWPGCNIKLTEIPQLALKLLGSHTSKPSAATIKYTKEGGKIQEG